MTGSAALLLSYTAGMMLLTLSVFCAGVSVGLRLARWRHGENDKEV